MTDMTINLCAENSDQTDYVNYLSYYPKKCSCGGLIHAEISNNRFHGLTVIYRCEDCGFTLDLIEE